MFWNLLNVSQIEYAWVSQETLIAASDLESAPMQYDLKMTHNIPDPWSMQVGESFVLEFTITNTNPVTSLEFDIGEMLGHPDSLTFGRPAVSFGNAYRHDDPIETAEDEGKLIHLDPLPSSTGSSSVSSSHWRLEPHSQVFLCNEESSGFSLFSTQKPPGMQLMLTTRW